MEAYPGVDFWSFRSPTQQESDYSTNMGVLSLG